MKKNKKNQEQKRKSHPLRLTRETIQILDPVLLDLAQGGMLSTVDSCDTATSSDTGC
jgi:hypothetical protein